MARNAEMPHLACFLQARKGFERLREFRQLIRAVRPVRTHQQVQVVCAQHAEAFFDGMDDQFAVVLPAVNRTAVPAFHRIRQKRGFERFLLAVEVMADMVRLQCAAALQLVLNVRADFLLRGLVETVVNLPQQLVAVRRPGADLRIEKNPVAFRPGDHLGVPFLALPAAVGRSGIQVIQPALDRLFDVPEIVRGDRIAAANHFRNHVIRAPQAPVRHLGIAVAPFARRSLAGGVGFLLQGQAQRGRAAGVKELASIGR